MSIQPANRIKHPAMYLRTRKSKHRQQENGPHTDRKATVAAM